MIYNFSSGPATLPHTVLQQIQKDTSNWQGTGMSIMEIGHRTPLFQDLLDNLRNKLRNLLRIPEQYHLLLLPGGGQGHFSFIPMNLTAKNQHVDYLVTGIWSDRAAQFAQRYAKVNIATTALADQITPYQQWQLNPKAAYVYYCANETIDGIQFPTIPEVGSVPLVADMTSCLLTENIEIERFGLVFAAAQKNLGIAGITLLIIRDDLLYQAQPLVPEVFHYRLQAEQGSLLNTIPTFPVYVMDLMLDWLVENHVDLSHINAVSQQKSAQIYQTIDASHGFYHNSIQPRYRSHINIPFELATPTLQTDFLAQAQAHGLAYLQGHRLKANIRASVYNAMPIEGVAKLVEFMVDFQAQHS